MPYYELILRSEFAAAHRLRLHDGSLEPLHGHNWQVEVVLQGTELDDTGLVADFVELQRLLGGIIGELDNTCLNEIPAFEDLNPSTEYVARHVHDRFTDRLPEGVRIERVCVWETAKCAAVFIPDPPPRSIRYDE